MGSSSVPTTPTGGRIGTAGLPSSFTAPAGWSFTAPARSSTEDIYRVLVTIPSTGTTPTYSRPFFLEPRLSSGGSTTPSDTSASVALTYGILDTDGTTQVSSQTTNTIHLETGGTHPFTVNIPATTAGQQYFFASVPSGFSITNVVDIGGGEGDVTSSWTVNGQQRRFGPLRQRSTTGRYTFTVRRN